MISPRSPGRRIAKKTDGTTVEKYLWSGRTTLLAVFDGADNLLMRFEYADGRMPVAMNRGGARYYLAYDQVGTLRLVTDSTGAVVKRIDYDTFGNVVADTNPAFSVPFGFAAGLHDRDTGLVRFGYRDYDPETGRWTAKDPILFAGGDTDLYGYCLGDPVNFLDPYGLESLGEKIAERVKWQIKAGGIKESNKLVTFEDNLNSRDKEMVKFIGAAGGILAARISGDKNLLRGSIQIIINTLPYSTTEVAGGNTNSIPYDHEIYFQIISGVYEHWPRENVGPFFFKGEKDRCASTSE
jgi:RHS repeat-associated protein